MRVTRSAMRASNPRRGRNRAGEGGGRGGASAPSLRGVATRAARAWAVAEGGGPTRRPRLNPLDVPTGGYTLLNLSAGLTRPMLGRIGRVDLAVKNVANVSYRSFLSRYKEFALDPGRNVVLRVSVGE